MFTDNELCIISLIIAQNALETRVPFFSEFCLFPSVYASNTGRVRYSGAAYRLEYNLLSCSRLTLSKRFPRVAPPTDKCAKKPCKNGATCEDTTNGYKCHCLPGLYIGQTCSEGTLIATSPPAELQGPGCMCPCLSFSVNLYLVRTPFKAGT